MPMKSPTIPPRALRWLETWPPLRRLDRVPFGRALLFGLLLGLLAGAAILGLPDEARLAVAAVVIALGGVVAWSGQPVGIWEVADAAEPLLGMAAIEGGNFVMGSPRYELGRQDDEKQQRVTLSAFRIDPSPLLPFAVKETVFPFSKFSGSDTTLGPEMRSTGEVMGRGLTFAEAYLKAQIAASNGLPREGCVFLGVVDEDKAAVVPMARALQKLGYRLLATPGTRRALRGAGLRDVGETSLTIEDETSLFRHMLSGELALVINTTHPRKRRIDATHLRRLILAYNIPYCSTLEAAGAMVDALAELGRERAFQYQPLRGFSPAAPRDPQSAAGA